jgi:hypothetical protein
MDQRIKSLDHQYGTLRRQRDEMTAFVRKLRILKQFRSKVKPY